MIPWAEIEPVLRDRAYRRIDADPQVLLESDVYGIPDRDVDLFYGRLFGYEDEVVRDGLWLSAAVPDILVPVPQRWRIRDFTPAAFWIEADPIRRARYVLQSSFVTMRVSRELYEFPPLGKLSEDHTVKIAFLRYRRRA